jgi:hypothetical protein
MTPGGFGMRGPLDDRERDTLVSLLAIRIAREELMRTWLITHVSHSDFAQALDSTPRDPHGWASLAVEIALDRGESYDPPWLDGLVAGLEQTGPVAELAQRMARERMRRRARGLEDPFTAQRLHHGRAFLDRESLRTGIRTLVFPSVRNLLVVTGPRESGKSYVDDYIEHLCRAPLECLPVPQGTAFRHLPVWIDPDEGATYGPEDLAIDLVSGMERPSTPPAPAGAHRLRQLASWIFDEAAQTGRRWFWCFDGFSNADLHDGARTLLHRILRRVASGGPAGERIRVALIDYPDPLPGQLEASAVTETLSPASGIGELDVREYLEGFRDVLDDAELEGFVAGALRDLPENGGRLSELQRRLEKITDALEKRQEAIDDA